MYRAQLIVRTAASHILVAWRELMTDRFPELARLAADCPRWQHAGRRRCGMDGPPPCTFAVCKNALDCARPCRKNCWPRRRYLLAYGPAGAWPARPAKTQLQGRRALMDGDHRQACRQMLLARIRPLCDADWDTLAQHRGTGHAMEAERLDAPKSFQPLTMWAAKRGDCVGNGKLDPLTGMRYDHEPRRARAAQPICSPNFSTIFWGGGFFSGRPTILCFHKLSG